MGLLFNIPYFEHWHQRWRISWRPSVSPGLNIFPASFSRNGQHMPAFFVLGNARAASGLCHGARNFEGMSGYPESLDRPAAKDPQRTAN
jgi:hypothetical protein